MLLWLPAGNSENTAGLYKSMERMDSVAVDRLETVPGGLVTSLTFSVLSPVPGLRKPVKVLAVSGQHWSQH